MRFLFFIVFLCLLFQKCKESPKVVPQKSIIWLDFTYTSPVEAIFYSLKITSGDTAYIKNYVPSQWDTSFYAILTDQDRSTLDSLINNMNLSALDTSYESDVTDGYDCTFTISKNDTLKAIYIHGGSVPEEMTRLTDYLIELKTKLKLLSIDKNN